MNVYATIDRTSPTRTTRPFTANPAAIRSAAWMRATRGLPIVWND